MEGQRLWDKGPYFAQSEHFKLGTDSVLLGDFVNIGGRVRGIDLGCGSGILPLLLLWRSSRLHMTGLEIDPAAADMARENMAENGLGGRCEIVTGDIKDCRLLFASGEFELVGSNPPYVAAGSGGVSPDGRKAAARGELLCSLEDVVREAGKCLKSKGKMYMVHRPNRLVDIFDTMRRHHLEPKRMRLVYPYVNKAANMVLIEAVKGGNSQLIVEEPLIVYKEDGNYTDALLKMYE